MNARFAHGFIALVLIACCASSQAMVQGKISDPEWFRGVRNKILVLEFDNQIPGETGLELADALGRLALGTITGVNEFAVITLRKEERTQDLKRPALEELASRQKTPVVIWGELYRNGGQLYVATHLRWFPSVFTNEQNISFTWADPRGTNRAEAILPTRQVNFAPIQIAEKTLEEIASSSEQSLVLRARRDPQAPQTGELLRDRPYYVLETANDWTRLKVKGGGEGWTHLTDLLRHKELNRLQGPVLYAQGLVQYLAGNLDASRVSFERYLEQFGASEDTMNRAVAHLVAGYAAFSHDQSANSSQAAGSHFEKAGKLLPNSAAPVNCQALVLFRKMAQTNAAPAEVSNVETQLIRAVEREQNLQAINNLQLLYAAPRAHEYFSVAPDRYADIQRDRKALLKDLQRKVSGQ